MYQRGSYYPLTIVTKKKDIELGISLLSGLEKVYFEPLDKKEGIVKITTEKSNNILYCSINGNIILFTSYLGADYNGPVRIPAFQDDKKRIKNMFLKHVNNPERLEEEHDRRLFNGDNINDLVNNRKLADIVHEKYSDICTAVGNYQLLK